MSTSTLHQTQDDELQFNLELSVVINIPKGYLMIKSAANEENRKGFVLKRNKFEASEYLDFKKFAGCN